MKKLFENFRNFVNEDTGNHPKSISHHWITHGCPVGQPQRIGEVLNHTLTESGKIEFYKVKFNDGIEILREDEFVGTTIQEHDHESRSMEDLGGGCDGSDKDEEGPFFDLLDESWPHADPGQGVGPGLPVEAGVANQYIDESWPGEDEGLV